MSGQATIRPSGRQRIVFSVNFRAADFSGAIIGECKQSCLYRANSVIHRPVQAESRRSAVLVEMAVARTKKSLTFSE